MKLVIHPAVEPERWEALRAAAPEAEWVNAGTPAKAEEAMTGADALLGKITPEMLSRADRLKWVQAFTVSLEHYMFPELTAHPCVLTNMRGLFGDVIADQVMGYVVCFARNLHTYIRQASRAPVRADRWRGGAGEQRGGAGNRGCHGSGDDLLAPGHDGHHRHGVDRLRGGATGTGFWDDGPRR